MPSSPRSTPRILRTDRVRLSKEGQKALQAVRGLVAALGRKARVIEQRTGITNAQLFFLKEIAADASLSVNALAARAMTHQSTASIVLSRLERRGLVRRVPSSEDGRSVVLQLTASGRRVLRRAPTTATNEVVRAIGRLTAGEVRMLRLGICALGREAGFPCDESPMLFQEPDTPKQRGLKRGLSARQPSRKASRRVGR